MNSYEIRAEMYRQILKKHPEEEKRMQEEIKVYELLSKVSDSEKYIIFDSTMFNDIFKGYVEFIMDQLSDSEDEEIKKAAKFLAPIVRSYSKDVLDFVSAEAAERYHYR